MDIDRSNNNNNNEWPMDAKQHPVTEEEDDDHHHYDDEEDKDSDDCSLSKICDTLLTICYRTEKVPCEELIQYCRHESIGLVHILAYIDTVQFARKYRQTNKQQPDNVFNFATFLSFCQNFTSEIKGIGNIFLAKCWNHNVEFQLDFLEFCINNNQIMNLFQCSMNKTHWKEISDWAKCLSEPTNANLCWKYVALYQLLVQLSKKEALYLRIEHLFGQPLEKCPDLLVLGLMAAFDYESNLMKNLLTKAIIKVIYPASNTPYHSNASMIVQKLWVFPTEKTPELGQKILVNAMLELYHKSSPEEQTNKLLRILEIAQDLKALNSLLNIDSYLFVIDLASVASRREYLKLDKWVNNKLAAIGKPFADACKQYVRQTWDSAMAGTKYKTSSHNETLSIIASCWKNYTDNRTTTYSADVKDMFKMFSQLAEDMMESNRQSDLNFSTSFGATEFSDDVFRRADGYLKKIFSQLTNHHQGKMYEKIFQFFETLKRSRNKNDNEVLICIIHTLFKEMDFLLEQYSAEELAIMGQLIGGIINHDLVESNLMAFILQKLFFLINLSKKHPRLMDFVQKALERCHGRLNRYASLDLKAFLQGVPQLARFAEVPHDNGMSMEAAKIVDFEFSERLNFVFNNLDTNNVTAVAKEYRSICEKNATNAHLFGESLTRRAIAEANHHELFLKLLDNIESSLMFDLVIRKTYTKVLEYLSKLDDVDLKRLYSGGRWLGMLTLGRDKPILSLYLDLHNLLSDADRKNMIVGVVPFVVKILHGSVTSRVFTPASPWMGSLLKRLYDIHQKQETKLKIKFEVEHLFKALDLDMDHFDWPRPPFWEKRPVTTAYLKIDSAILPEELTGKVVPRTKDLPMSTVNQTVINSPPDQSSVDTESSLSQVDIFLSLVLNIRISKRIKLIQCIPNLAESLRKQLVTILHEWLHAFMDQFYMVLESIEFSVRKDFQLNSDRNVVQNCANNWIRFSLSRYVMTTCRETLPGSMMEKLQRFICTKIPNPTLDHNRQLVADAIVNLLEDNLDLFVNVIRELLVNCAMEKLKQVKPIGSPELPSGIEECRIRHFYESLDVKCQPDNQNDEQNPILVNQVKDIFSKWFRIYINKQDNQEAEKWIITNSFTNNESLFFLLKTSFDICYSESKKLLAAASDRSLPEARFECYELLDAYVEMTLCLIKTYNVNFKVAALDRILNYLATHAHDKQRKDPLQFFPFCYHRVLALFFRPFTAEVRQPSQDISIINFKVALLRIFYKFLKSMSPINVPSFTFAWLDFISNRDFIGLCLDSGDDSSPKLWHIYYLLLADFLEFQKGFFLFKKEAKPICVLYQATLKLLLLLKHDFPDFLTQYCYLISDHTPHNAFQYRNILQCASPEVINQSDLIADIGIEPILYPFHGKLSTESPFKEQIDLFFETREFIHLRELVKFFESAKNLYTRIKYINLVLNSISEHVVATNLLIDMKNLHAEPSVLIIACLLELINTEDRYYLFGAMIYHLRYPNNETKFYVCVLCHFFANNPHYKEVIFRVTLERATVYGPHPWGLLYLVAQLTKNPAMGFSAFMESLDHQTQDGLKKLKYFPN